MRPYTHLVGVCLAALSAPSLAQTAATDANVSAATPTADEGEIIVTAVARSANRLNTSISVSTIDAGRIAQTAPRSAAELFRALPGIRSESSGGEGNANIAVRGLPVASGGAKFLQLQEDGLPILEFGDITFGNADIFLRIDRNIGRVESVRGGSSSTFASNSPGGIINLISKTGETTGGAIQGEAGLDFDQYRVDVDYGAKLADGWRFHVGGFYRSGEGPRRAGYQANRGGQIKANITKEFARGYVRIYGKYLDDRAIGYLPNPVRVTGTNADPRYSDLPGFRINSDTLHSRLFTRGRTLGSENQPVTDNIKEGQRPLVRSVGFEAQFRPSADLTITERFRYSDTSGRFISPFPANVDAPASIATNLAGPGSTLRFANGPNAGQAYATPSGLLAQIVLFDTKLNSLDNITNDIRGSYEFGLGGGRATLTGGFYASRQTIDTDWLWGSYLLEVRGGGRAALVDLFNAAGVQQTDGGQYGYGATFFGNCCRRAYNLNYTTTAPFAALSWTTGKLTLDASGRWDFGAARGSVAGADLGGGRVGVTSFDFNANGIISPAESRTSIIPLAAPQRVRYDYDYASWSFGANYLIKPDLSVFARASRGARANADRLQFGPQIQADGSLRGRAADAVNQQEFGFKYRRAGLSLYGTGFHATTQEQNFEATTQRFFDRSYEAWGAEIEAGYRTGRFTFTGGATYTTAEITRDALNAGVEGNTPRRQADFIYQAAARYDAERFALGANVIGTTDSFTQDVNQLKLPGFAQVNAFAEVRPLKRVAVGVNANNLFDTNGFTEAEEAAIPGNGIVRARSINGRTVAAFVRLEF